MWTVSIIRVFGQERSPEVEKRSIGDLFSRQLLSTTTKQGLIQQNLPDFLLQTWSTDQLLLPIKLPYETTLWSRLICFLVFLLSQPIFLGNMQFFYDSKWRARKIRIFTTPTQETILSSSSVPPVEFLPYPIPIISTPILAPYP